MRNKTIQLVAISLTLVMGVTVMGGAIAANETTSTTTEKPEKDSSYVVQLSQYTTVVDYKFENSTAYVTIKTERVTLLKLGSMFMKGTGASKLPTKQFMLKPGTHQIQLKVEKSGGYIGVTVASSNGVIGIKEKTGGMDLFNGTYTGDTVAIASILGVVVGITAVIVASYKQRYNIETSTERAL